MLCDIKNQLDCPHVQNLIMASAWDQSETTTNKKIAQWRTGQDLCLYGWVAEGVVLGVCGIVLTTTHIEIVNIAVAPHMRKQGIGYAMIMALRQKYPLPIKAETDDDAVDFYKKCGFEIKGIIKQYGEVACQRYHCTLPLINASL